MSFLEVAPLVFVMVAGPQILSAIFLATSENWRRNSVAFVGGAALSITLVVTVAYVLGIGAVGQGTSNATLSALVVCALVLAMVHTYRTRDDSAPPRWMGKLGSATPGFSFKFGFLLLGFFPTDVLTSASVGSYLAARGAPWTDALAFIALTLLVLALPSLVLAAFGTRAEALLPKIRTWMTTHAWIVTEVVIGFFLATALTNLLG